MTITRFFRPIRLVFLILAIFSLVSCAFDKSDNDPNRRRDLNNRDKLLRAYQAIQGVYEGTFTTPQRIENVRLSLSYTEVEVGKSQDGEKRYQPELRARLSRLDRDLFDTYLSASLIPETSDLTLSTAENGGETLYIRGIVANERFDAPVRNRDGGEIGEMRLSLRSRQVIAPPEGQGNETYDRIKQVLLPVQGIYVAYVKRYEGTKLDPFCVDIIIRVEDQLVNGQVLPYLAAYSRRADGYSTAGKHVVTYNTARIPPEVTFTPSPGSVGYSAWTLKAIFRNGEFSGDAVYPTFVATMAAKRKAESSSLIVIGGKEVCKGVK